MRKTIYYTVGLGTKEALKIFKSISFSVPHHFDRVYNYHYDDAVIYIHDSIDRPQSSKDFSDVVEYYGYDNDFINVSDYTIRTLIGSLSQ